MVEFKVFGMRVRFTFWFFAVLTMILFLDRSGTAFWALTASLLHETGHVLAFFILHSKPHLLSFELSGIRLVRGGCGVSVWKEFVILSAGCAVNFVTAVLLQQTMPFVAAVHLCLGAFNLLPIHSLDGGKLIRLLFSCLFPYTVSRVLSLVVSYLTVFLLLFVGGLLCIKGNFTLLITAVYLLLMLLSEK